ncbi:MAG: GNAT family N-acetyltransferase [Armatimonadetes bacterium]|nr:GNAT family N-acetyltransferase [Armatimonadota bacterium]
MENQTVIRRMTASDVGLGMMLKDMAGWNQLRGDWERLLAAEPDGCFVAEVAGTGVGTCTTIAYERLFGWVGMVLVHPDYRRRGIGRALLDAGIDHLEGLGVSAVKLDATPMGKALYDTMGFVDEYGLERWLGRGLASVKRVPGMRQLTIDDLGAILALDAAVFGADRGRLLNLLLTDPSVRVAGRCTDEGELSGYVAVRPGQKAAYLGPLVAENADVATALWEWGRGTVGDLPTFVDVLLPNRAAVELVQSSGFEKQREFIRMYRGRNTSPGRPEWQYAILGPEVG